MPPQPAAQDPAADLAIPTSIGGRSRWDYAFGEWRVLINLETGKIEVARANRPELAHLTISWRNRSGSLDVHLTYDHEAASRGEAPKSWEPIFSQPLNEVARQLESIFRGMLGFYEFAGSVYKRYRPGWLRDHGYLVTMMPRDRVHLMLKKALPRKKGKYRLDVESAFKDEVIAAGPPEYVDPAILRYVDLSSIAMPVLVRRPNRPGKYSSNMIFLQYRFDVDGRMGWWGISRRDQDRVDLRFARLLSDCVLPLVTAKHAEIAERIVEDLGLDQFPETQGLARDLRAFFRERRNPYWAVSSRTKEGTATP